MNVDQCIIIFEASEWGETGARYEGAKWVLCGHLHQWQRARGRGASVGRGMPPAVSCGNRYENLMERDCGPLHPAEGQIRELRDEVRQLREMISGMKIGADDVQGPMTNHQQDGLAASQDTNRANNRREKNVNEIKTGAVRKTSCTQLDVSRIKSTSFTKYHVIQMENELKKKLNPFAA